MPTHYGIVNELLTFDVEVELPEGATMQQVDDAIAQTHVMGLAKLRHRTRIFHPVGIKAGDLDAKAPTTVVPTDVP